MRFYDVFMYPLEKLTLNRIRKDLMPRAKGKVLEIGFGTGVNMKYYDFKKITSFHALDVHEDMPQFDNVHYHILSAEKLPFDDETFDTVVLTLALCSIPNVRSALQEIKRVLKKEGQYLYIEHEEPENKIGKFVFNRLNPLWKRMSKGCQINLKSHKVIEEEGFEITHQNKGIFHYGVAKST